MRVNTPAEKYGLKIILLAVENRGEECEKHD
jgi:hypothetical protein